MDKYLFLVLCEIILYNVERNYTKKSICITDRDTNNSVNYLHIHVHVCVIHIIIW